MPLQEIQQKTTMKELQTWMVFLNQEERRTTKQDWQFAQVVQGQYANAKKTPKLEACLLKWEEPKEDKTKNMTKEEATAHAKAIMGQAFKMSLKGR